VLVEVKVPRRQQGARDGDAQRLRPLRLVGSVGGPPVLARAGSVGDDAIERVLGLHARRQAGRQADSHAGRQTDRYARANT
jgi:hypothetical protein